MVAQVLSDLGPAVRLPGRHLARSDWVKGCASAPVGFVSLHAKELQEFGAGALLACHDGADKGWGDSHGARDFDLRLGSTQQYQLAAHNVHAGHNTPKTK